MFKAVAALVLLIGAFCIREVLSQCQIWNGTTFKSRTLFCVNLTDDDLPFPDDAFPGHFVTFRFQETNVTRLPKNAFGTTSFSSIVINANPRLADVTYGFLGANPAVKDVALISAPLVT